LRLNGYGKVCGQGSFAKIRSSSLRFFRICLLPMPEPVSAESKYQEWVDGVTK
jgi:hypothetical protein